jgi:hypothetical protein
MRHFPSRLGVGFAISGKVDRAAGMMGNFTSALSGKIKSVFARPDRSA